MTSRWWYVCIDLPEILCLSSYYLIMCYPNKNILLYGEKNINNWSVKENNLVFLPSYKIHALKDNSVDLFINKNSLGEMGKLSAQNYLKHIKRSTKYFFHINHDNYRDHISNNSAGLLASEYNLGGDFKQLYRYPDLGHFSPNGQYNYSNDIFCYLYEKEN